MANRLATLAQVAQSTKASPELELELSVEQRATLEREFKLYEDLAEQLDDTARDLAVSKGVLDGLRVELGVRSVGFDGYHCTDVSGGTTRSLDLKALCKAFTITPRQLAGFYKEKPKKGYTLVTTPKSEAKAKLAAAAKAAKKAAAPRDERDDYEDRDE